MKRIDITRSVMDKVVQFEQRRVKRWITVFAAIAVLLAVFAAIFLFRTYVVLSERHTFDVLEIIYEEREIISEFWQDSFSVALAELPQTTLLLGSAASLVLVIIWIITRRRRQIVKRRLAELAKRKQKSNNT